LEECYLARDLTPLEQKLTKSPGFTAVRDEANLVLFAIVSQDFNFFNMDITLPPDMDEQPPIGESPLSPKTLKATTPSGQTKQSLQSSRLPNHLLKSVWPLQDDSHEYEDDTSYFYNTVFSITTSVNDIQPDLLTETFSTGFSGSFTAKNQNPLHADDFFAFKLHGVPIDDGFWGITLANRSFYRKNFDTLYASRDDPALYQDYVHQMSEAFKSGDCGKSDFGGECLLSKLASEIMNPIYTEELLFKNKPILTGFTTYRVVPFFGIDLSDSQNSMLMPQDDFVTQYGGIGFGAASTVTKVKGVDDAIFSFGGFSYAPDSKYRPFEKLPHGDRFPKRRSWYPVWHRHSIVHGCAEAAQSCTYEDHFDLNTNPRNNMFTPPAVGVFIPLAAKRHSVDHYYALVRNPIF
jgi:hypothetical protein